MTEVARTWRPRPFARAMARVYIVGFVAAVITGVIDLALNGEPTLIVLAGVGGVPLLMISVLMGLRPFIATDGQGLHIRNPVRRHDLSWAEITEVHPGYHGLEIMTRERGVVIAFAVQKSNLASWLKRRTRADDVAELLQRSAEQARDGSTAE